MAHPGLRTSKPVARTPRTLRNAQAPPFNPNLAFTVMDDEEHNGGCLFIFIPLD